MRPLVQALLLAIVCAAGLIQVRSDKVCAVTRRAVKAETDSQGSADDIEDAFNTNDHNQTENNIKFEKCSQYCYALWEEESTSNGTKINIFLQGCWKQEGHFCENTECIANKCTKAISNTKFCCCKEDYCNVNITDPFENKLLLTSPASKNNLSVIVTATDILEKVDSDDVMLVTSTILASVLLVTLIVMILIYQVYRNVILIRLGKPVPYNDSYGDSNGLKTGTYTVDHLKLSTIVGQGKYGSVWQGSMGDEEVAVKIFPGHYQSYFLNERDIYCLPFMEHPSLLHYYGSDERTSMDGSVEYLMVFSYAPDGTLMEFLRYHTFDWMTFCKMGLSIVKGLAYLHTDIRKGDKFKPCIAHRDINSKNILIKADGTCCICDLGLAVQISGSKYYSNGEEQHAEKKSINDVGTLQYMAPEVLEGAVNLRDCESSLKQIDVYAMGIILWELVSRCTDIYMPGIEVPPYRQPFEKEIGLHPTFDQMQVLVSRNKARPLFEANLVDKPGVRLIRETMEDCWDADAEARLTALCIEERMMELQSHRITMHFTDGSPMMNSHCGLVPSTTNSLYSDVPHRDGAHHVVQITGHDCNDVAVDNLVTLTPNENSTHEHSGKNSNETNAHAAAAALMVVRSTYAQPQPQPQLQPYQGRNPCMERNLMLQSDSCEELGCHGNILVNKSANRRDADKLLPALSASTATQSSNSETQSLMPHDYLGQMQQQQQQHQQSQSQQQHHHHYSQQLSLRSVTPIPYVQNVISECSNSGGGSAYNKLKQTNIQESCYTALPSTPQEASSPRRRRFSGWTSLKRMLASRKLMYSQHQPAYSKCEIEREDSKSNLLASKNAAAAAAGTHHLPKIVETNVSISPAGKYVNGIVPSPVGARLEPRARDCSSGGPSTLPLVSLRRSAKKPETSSLSRQESLDRVKNAGGASARASSQTVTARLSLYDDRIMSGTTSEEEDGQTGCQSPSVARSAPFGMDVAADERASAKLDSAKNVTCF